MNEFVELLDTEIEKRKQKSSGGPRGLAGGELHEQAEFMRQKENESFLRKQATLAEMKRKDPELYEKVTGNKIEEVK